VFRRFDRIIAVNHELVRLFQSFGVARDRIRLILPYTVPSAVQNEPLPASLSRFFAAHHPVLVSVGQLEPEYDLPLQIDALGDLRRRLPNAGLIIAGSGSLEAELSARIRSLPQGPHVYLYGDMPHQITIQTIARSDALIRTTRYDGDSVAIREAMHLGRPVVATDNGMRPSGVRLIPMNNRVALCTAIEECLTRPRHAVPPAPVADNAQQVLELYRELCAE
jgi:glycosyltransferase involved in cell wall biosynthesis